MRKRSPKARKCPVCRLPSIKHGRAASGTQRWRCKDCELSFTASHQGRSDPSDFESFIGYATGKFTKNDLAGLGHVSRSTLARKWEWCWQVPTPKPPITGEIYDQVFLDGIYLNDGWVLLSVVNQRMQVVAWQWASSETTQAYEALIQGLAPPLMLTIDGAKGALGAYRNQWEKEGTALQRCLLHIHRNNVKDLTNRPRTEAGRALLALSRRITKIRSLDEVSTWEEALAAVHSLYGTWISHRTFAKDNPVEALRRGRKNWWYTHERDRRVYYRLVRLNRSGTMWNYLTSAGANLTFSPFTNHVESINSQIRRLLDHHRGLSPAHMQTVIEWLLHSKTENPTPATEIFKQWDQGGRPSKQILPQKTHPKPRALGPEKWGTATTPEEGLWTRKGWAGRWQP